MRADAPWRSAEAREPRAARTRRRIYDAALREFRRVGFGSASVARIARLAGVSRPSFYFHFPTKEHVLLELQWVLEHEVVEAMAGVDDPVGAVHTFVDELVRVEERVGRGDLFRDLLQVWVRPPRDLDVEEHVLPVVEAIAARFVHARAAGRLRAGLDPARATVLFLTGVFGYLLGVGGAAEDERAELHALVDLYLSPASP